MTPRNGLMLGLAGIVLLWLMFGYFGIHRLVTNTTVNETLPMAAREGVPSTDVAQVTSTATLPVETPQLISAGVFKQGDSTYAIKGTVKVVTENNQKVLTLTDFDVTNGPDLFVYVVAASSTENASLKQQVAQGRFIQLAELKGNRGNQVYALPADLDLSAYPVVSIWCRRFSRNFGSALLQVKP